jgi:dihydroorotate dehydrogenase
MLDRLYPLARKCLFCLNPELAHEVSMVGLRVSERLGILRALADDPLATEPVRCMGLEFPNPVGLAAGLDKEGNCIDALGRLGFGFIEMGTITPLAQPGNPKPRLYRLKSHEGIINRMGFNNSGIEQGVENVGGSRTYEGIIGFNIGKNKVTPNENAVDDYLIGLRAAWPVADYIAVNLSSPNTPGLRDLQEADSTARLLERLKKEQERLAAESGKQVPIALKIAPDLDADHIKALCRVFLDGGLEGLIATNTTIERKAVEGHPLAGETGGLSGAPLTRQATEIISAFHADLGSKVPIIGVGGIMSPGDAIAKLTAGATLLQIYTGFIYKGPGLITGILEALKQHAMKEAGKCRPQ